MGHPRGNRWTNTNRTILDTAGRSSVSFDKLKSTNIADEPSSTSRTCLKSCQMAKMNTNWHVILSIAVSFSLLVHVNSQSSDQTTTKPSSRPINVFVINQEGNDDAGRTVTNSLKTLQVQHPDWLGNIMKLDVKPLDSQSTGELICKFWDSAMLNTSGGTPDLILDITRNGLSAEMVNVISAAIGVPTLSAQFGQKSDLRGWRELDEDQQKYLVQVMPPADLIPEVIRELALEMNISNAAIIFDKGFVMDHKYKSLLLNVPTRHVIIRAKNDTKEIADQLVQLRNLDIVNFFVLGEENVIRDYLEAAESRNFTGRKYGWYGFTMDEEARPQCGCRNISVVLFKPKVTTKNQQQVGELKSKGLLPPPSLTSSFYFDLTRLGIQAMKTALDTNRWPAEPQHIPCELGKKEITPKRNFNFLEILKETTKDSAFQPTFADFNWGEQNGEHHMSFEMDVSMEIIRDGNSVGTDELGVWKAGLTSPLKLSAESASKVNNHTAVTSFRVVTVELAPFMQYDKETGKWSGYCIDLMEDIREILGFEYEIYEVPDKQFGSMAPDQTWDGMIRELIDKRADIALGTLSVMAERENVVDFTVPYYDLVGISILMLKPKTPTSLFKFLTVLEDDVWLCILGSYFFTSFLMWIFDRWSPYSYQNNKEKYKEDEEKREFNLKECLWFCMTSLTPQGGGEAPKNLSGRLVAATWWLFGFIIIASYTANLAAFLTVSRLETPIESLDDLSKQYKIQYSPVKPSEAYTYFERMANIETKFYEIWKDMSLNDSLTEVERAQLAVWDYPVSDRYTKMFQAMKESGFPSSRDEALARVRRELKNHSSTDFAFIGDATAIRYLEMTTCDLTMVGDEFSRKPYAIAVQQGSPLKDQFNNAILQLLNKRRLESLKNKWWNLNPKRRECEKEDDQSDGISIQNIGGVFIVIFVGIFLACGTLAFEYWWFRYRPRMQEEKRRKAGNLGGSSKDIKPLRFQLKPARPDFPTRSDFRSRF